jgi:purine-cytosine permease-like protein
VATGSGGDPHQFLRGEFAHDLAELKEDLAFERETLGESISHDYSTSETGVVPLDRRRPIWHFAGLWTSFAAGFSFLFVGTELYAGGHDLAATALITCIGIVIYVAYAMLAAYLGSRTGQTHALLTRSIFGVSGSWLVSLFIIVGATGWTGFQAGLMVQIWQGLYSWGHVELLTIVFAALMVFNNLFGFTGITVFARYLVTPLLIVWILYLVIKVLTTDSGILNDQPKGGSGLSFLAGIAVVIGFAMWGNEPDVFRYGKPRFWWPAPAFGFALVFGFLLFSVGGWMMADIAHTADFAPVVRTTTQYSLFGALWLAFGLGTLSQFAINDGNYYEAINGGQNIIGGWRRWRRWYTCLILAGGGALSGWLVNYQFTDGFFKVAAFLAITVPTASMIMFIDHFLLPRWFGISRPLTRVPSWAETAWFNWPALIALTGAVFFGAWASGIVPGEDPSRLWGIPPLEAWLLGGVTYLAGTALTRAIASDRLREALGFSRIVRDDTVPAGAVIDIASLAGVAPGATGNQPKTAPAGAS